MLPPEPTATNVLFAKIIPYKEPLVRELIVPDVHEIVSDDVYNFP